MGDLFYESDLSRFGPFVAGLLLAYWQTRYSERIKKIFQNKTTSYAVFLISSGLFMAVFALPLYNPNSWYYSGFTPERNFLMLVSIRQAFAVALTLFMLGCWHGKGPFLAIKNFFSLRIWTPISRLSFPIYLFHFPFIAVAAVLVFGTTDVKMVTHVSFLQGLAVFLVAVATTIGFSIPLYVYIERPFIEKAKTPR